VFIAFTFSAAPLLFELLIRRFGWRGAWLVLGVVEAVGFTTFVLVFFRDDPHSCGLHPDGATPEPGSETNDGAEGSWTLPRARGTLTFWIFNLGLSLFSLQVTALTFHIVSIFKTGGLTRADAVSVFLPASAISVALNLGGGLASDRPFIRNRLKWYLIVLLGGIALSSAGALTPMLRSGAGRWMIIVGHGVAGGFFGLLTAIVWPRSFGPRHLGAISGYNVSFMVFASAVGPPLFGAVQNLPGGYNIALGGAIAVVAILAPLALWANKPSAVPGA
jgi:cyanate permease